MLITLFFISLSLFVIFSIVAIIENNSKSNIAEIVGVRHGVFNDIVLFAFISLLLTGAASLLTTRDITTIYNPGEYQIIQNARTTNIITKEKDALEKNELYDLYVIGELKKNKNLKLIIVRGINQFGLTMHTFFYIQRNENE